MHVMVKFILLNKHYQGLFFDSSLVIFTVFLSEQFSIGPTSNLPNNPWMQIRGWEFSLACADHQLGCVACFHSILFTQRESASACLFQLQRISQEILAQQNCYYFHLILPTAFSSFKIYWEVEYISLSKSPLFVSLGCA